MVIQRTKFMLQKVNPILTVKKSTLSKLKRTGATEIFILPVGNEEPGTKEFFLDFTQKANTLRTQLLEEPEPRGSS